MPIAAAIVALTVAVIGCSGSGAGSSDRAATDSIPEGPPVPEAPTAVSAAMLEGTIDRGVVIYVEATPAEIDAVRAGLTDEDFAVVADDLMYYRATATEYLESAGRPYVRVQGRRPLAFVVAGAAREYDFTDVELLDFIIAYAPGAEPRIVAPNEVELAAPCTAPATAPALDHVVILVGNLDRASDAFRSEGFRIKQGRQHANGLLNRHVKFRDGTSIELMSLAGEPTDRMAQDYADLLRAGEGGVYVALAVHDLAAVEEAAGALGLATRRTASGAWEFASFPQASPAAAVFFGSGDFRVSDADSLLAHDMDASGLKEAWLEGGAELGQLLASLGAVHCGTTTSPRGAAGERYALRNGSVVIVPIADAARPRVLGVELTTPSPRGVTVFPHERFRVHY